MSSDGEMLSKRTALIVEDHPFSRTTLVTMLKRLGFDQVWGASDGQEAVNVLNQHYVDVVITDINMPKMNGIELLKLIRTNQTENSPATKVIAVTSYSNIEVIRACMSLDINAFLVKPITLDNVKNKVMLAIVENTELCHQDKYEHVNSDFDTISEAPPPPSRPAAPNFPDEMPPEPKAPPVVRRANDMIYMTINKLSHLEPGMILMQDLCAKNGSCLVAQGIALNRSVLNRLNELSSIIELDQLKVKKLAE